MLGLIFGTIIGRLNLDPSFYFSEFINYELLMSSILNCMLYKFAYIALPPQGHPLGLIESLAIVLQERLEYAFL